MLKKIVMTIFVIFSVINVSNAGSIKEYKDGYLYSGKVERGDQVLVSNLPKGSILYMDSLGGNAKIGFAMGEEIQNNEIKIRVKGGFFGAGCVSACAIAAVHADDIEGEFEFHLAYLPKSSVYHGTETGEKALKVINDQVRALLKERGLEEHIPAFNETGETWYHTIKF